MIDKERIFLLDKDLKIIHNNLGTIGINTVGYILPDIIKQYFESQNNPISKAETRRLLLVIFISIILFSGLTWGTIKVRSHQIAKRERIKRELSEMELKSIRSQMNPHFVFNALGSIQNLINQNKIKNANLYLSSFARLLRMVLNNSNKQLVSMADEIELLQHYLELEQLRVDFQFEIKIA